MTNLTSYVPFLVAPALNTFPVSILWKRNHPPKRINQHRYGGQNLDWKL